MKKKIVSCLLVAVMCTLIGSVAYADESGSMYRSDNIKSHGTLLCEQADSDEEVYITSQDLIYLAGEMDLLEDIIDGLQYKDNPNVEYTYHYHHTGDGSVSSGKLYAEITPGGCYYDAGHTHNMTGECPTHIVRHDAEECDGVGGPYGHHPSCNGEDHTNCGHSCTICGAPVGGTGQKCGRVVRPAWDETVYDCGSPTNTWTVQCGWREGAIEKAEIKFSPN